MLTECPHCLSVLKVSAELIYAGDPRVRCGECLRVFSARDHLTQADADLDTTKIYQPPQREAATIEEGNFSLKPEVAEGLQAIVDKPLKTKPTVEAASTTAELTTVERSRRPAIPSRATDTPDTSDKKNKAASPLSATIKTSITSAATAEGAKDIAENPKDRHISVLARDNTTGRSAPEHSWSVLTLLLIGILTLLAINAIRNVINDENMRADLSNIWCDISNCQASASRDFSQLKIVRRKIYAHPNAEGVLVISLAMINQHHKEMEYPTLQVRMTDQSGEVIARGHFEPSHYVTGYQTGMTIAPERVLDVVLQVEDPGEAAQSFDLEFQ